MFSTGGCHSSIWPEATTLGRSQRSFVRPEAATVHCGRRPHQFKSKNTLQLWSPHLLASVGVKDTEAVMLTGHSIWYNILYIFYQYIYNPKIHFHDLFCQCITYDSSIFLAFRGSNSKLQDISKNSCLSKENDRQIFFYKSPD